MRRMETPVSSSSIGGWDEEKEAKQQELVIGRLTRGEAGGMKKQRGKMLPTVNPHANYTHKTQVDEGAG